MSTEGGREVLGMQFANHHSLTSSQGNHATQVADQASVPMGIRQSIIANPSNAVAQVEGLGSEASKDQKPISKYRISIDDRIYSMATQRAPELPVVHDPHGDTYVFIDPSRKQPEQDESDYAQYIKRYQGPALMNKDTLTKYSPYLAKAFSPSAQFRTLRRRKLLKGLPPNVKYVIDLTPPSEGDEAVYLTTLLSCSEGVRLWYQSSQIWNVSELLVKGEDEHSSFKSPKATQPISSHYALAAEIQPNQQRHNSTTNRSAPVLKIAVERSASSLSHSSPETLIPLEYTPVRHRSAIERVLAALQGRDPQLDSAIKLWTTFAVAKYFEITHSPLEDYIIRWLRAYPNSFFLEVLPEASHQIADGLQNSDLARDTFAILVGEEALDSLRRHRELHGFYKHNSYGRKKEELPEHIHTRIEYASKNFLRRINNDFNNLAGTRMQWIEDLPEVQMLSSYTQPEIQPTIEALKVLLKDYVRGTIYKLLCANYDSMPQPELHHEGGHDLLPRLSRSLVWCNMTKNERIMSRTFWEALKSFTIFKGNTNLDVSGGWDMWERHASYLSTVEKRELDQGTYRKIELEELKALFREGERFLNDEKPNPLITLPFRPSRAARSPSMVPSEQSSLHKTDDTSALACASSPTLTPPIDIPELSRSAQRDSDGEVTLSDDKLNVTHVQAKKWPHGLAREYPMPGVQRDIEGLHVSSPPSAERDAAEEVPKAMAFANPESWDAKYGCADDLQQSSDVSSPKTYNRIFFHLPTFFRQVEEYIDSFARRKLQSSDQSTRAEPLEVGITNTLVCLEDEEWKYLPPWAGGNDDGSMGVYNDDIPFADQVFSTPGPGVHDGTAPTPSSGAPSEFEMVTERPDSSVFNTSTATNRDFSDALRCRRVHIAESADMSSNDGFTIVTPLVDSDDEEKLARKQMEAQESIEAAEEAATNKALRFGRENGMTIDEDDGSADLFNSDDEDTDRADDGDLDGEEEEDMVMV